MKSLLELLLRLRMFVLEIPLEQKHLFELLFPTIDQEIEAQ